MYVIEKFEDSIRFMLGDLLFQQLVMKQELDAKDQRITELQDKLNNYDNSTDTRT